LIEAPGYLAGLGPRRYPATKHKTSADASQADSCGRFLASDNREPFDPGTLRRQYHLPSSKLDHQYGLRGARKPLFDAPWGRDGRFRSTHQRRARAADRPAKLLKTFSIREI